MQRNEKKDNTHFLYNKIAMDINHIKLDNNLIADLYSNLLVENKNIAETAAISINDGIISKERKENFSTIKSLGENSKNILLVVTYKDSAFLPDDQLNFLTKILTACKLSLADVAIFNLHPFAGKPYNEIISHFNSKTVLLFGLSPKDFGMPIQFPVYQVQAFNKTTFLYSPVLEQLERDPKEKSKFWKCLKNIFSL